MHANKIFELNFIQEKYLVMPAMIIIYGKFFECIILISRSFYLREAVYFVHYAKYTVDNILLMEAPFL